MEKNHKEQGLSPYSLTTRKAQESGYLLSCEEVEGTVFESCVNAYLPLKPKQCDSNF